MAVRRPLATLDDAYEAAVRLLARKARTAAEVAEELSNRGAAADDVASVVARLKAHRHVDDAELAHDQAFALVDGKGLSSSAAVETLLGRGVPATAAREAVAAVLEGRGERELCDAALQRRLRGARLQPASAARESRALARLGHDAEIVARVIEQALGHGADPDRTR